MHRFRASPAPPRRRFPLAVGTLTVALVLGGCGGGSGDDRAAAAPAPSSPALAATPGTPGTLLLGDRGVPAASVDTETLRGAAAEHAARGLGTNARALTGFRGGVDGTFARLRSAALASAATRPDGTFDDDGVDGGVDGGAVALDGVLSSLDRVDAAAAALLRATLGLDGDAARVVREGDSVRIDPDERAVCDAGAPEADVEDARRCRELAGRLEVRLDALSADSGWLSYRFDGGEVLRVGYGPVNSVYELSLAGVAAVAFARATLAGEDASGVPGMGGRLRLSLGAIERATGRERAHASLDVVEPLAIVDPDGGALRLAPSTLFSIEADAATGTVGLRVDLGALSLIRSVDAADGPAGATAGTAEWRMAGLTAEVTFDAREEVLVATNVGIGRGPFTYTLDGAQLARLDLGEVGFRLDAEGRLAVHGDLALALLLNDVLDGGGSRTAFSLAASDGTVVVPGEGDGFAVASGSFDASLSHVSADGQSVHGESLRLAAGECASSDPFAAWDAGDSSEVRLSLLPVQVPCPR